MTATTIDKNIISRTEISRKVKLQVMDREDRLDRKFAKERVVKLAERQQKPKLPK